MTADADLLVDSYVNWLQRGVTGHSLTEKISELTTPFLDRHNDRIQVYAEWRSPDLILLTDDGYIVSELKSSGVETRGARREELIRSLLAGHGVRLEGGELQVDSKPEEIGRKVHGLVQAMLSLDDMFVLAQPTEGLTFLHDVANFFDEQDIRYTPAAKFPGKSGLDHLINFVIPKSRSAPERFVQVINSPRRDRVENMLFAITDTRGGRHGSADFYAIVNDGRRNLGLDSFKAFEAYDVKARSWSHRDEMIEELAA